MTIMNIRLFRSAVMMISLILLQVSAAAQDIVWERDNTFPLAPYRSGVVTSILTGDDGSIVAGTTWGIWYSPGFGQEWSEPAGLPLPDEYGNLDVQAMVKVGGRLLAGIEEHGMYSSQDGGRTWEEVAGLDATYINDIQLVPDGRMYAATDNGLFVSADTGASWTPLGLQHEWALCMEVTSRGTLLAYLWTMVRSTDNGATWDTLPEMAFSIIPPFITSDATGRLYLATDTLYRSTDDGITWQKVSKPPGPSGPQLIQTGEGRFLYVSAAGLFQSTDDCLSWTRYGTGLEREPASAFAFDRQGYMYVGTNTARLYRTTKGVSSVEDERVSGNGAVKLSVSPNPVSGHGTLTFMLPASGRVRLSLFDLLGCERHVLAEGKYEAGGHTVMFDAASLAAGYYMVRLASETGSVSRSLVVEGR